MIKYCSLKPENQVEKSGQRKFSIWTVFDGFIENFKTQLESSRPLEQTSVQNWIPSQYELLHPGSLCYLGTKHMNIRESQSMIHTIVVFLVNCQT